jgi:hypothetical protein
MMKCRAFLASAIGLLLIGCGAARYTQRDAAGGTLAVQDHSQE